MRLYREISLSLLIPVLFSPVTNRNKANSGISGKRPVNILFLFSDDQRFNTIHELGNNGIITPNLDNLVRTGTTFTRAYIMGGSQGAVSVPSRAMLMTGKYLYNLERTGSFIPENHIMLGEYLQKYGYDVYGTGKWHNGFASSARNFSSGGNLFFGGMSDQFNVLVWNFDPSGKYQKDSTMNQPHINKNKNATELFSDDAVKYLENNKGEKPFFLYVAFTSPHDPRVMPPEFLDMYNTSKISLPENFLPQHPFDNGELKIRDELLAGFPRTNAEIRIHIRDYYAMITHLDAEIGRILDALRNSGQYNNTVIIFAGDNGLALGQHGLMGKQNVYEHSVHIPLIFCGPDIPEDQRVPAFCYLTDIFPTLCEMLGFEIPSTVEGISLFTCINKRRRIVREHLYFAYRDYQRAVRDERYKLIEYNVNGIRNTQLFDLKADPWETTNIATKLKYGKKIEHLRQVMLEQKKLTGDNSPFWNGMEFSANRK